MRNVNLEGLSEDQLDLVERFADLLRRAHDRTTVRGDLKQLLAKRRAVAPDLSDEEADRLASDAVASARGRV